MGYEMELKKTIKTNLLLSQRATRHLGLGWITAVGNKNYFDCFYFSK